MPELDERLNTPELLMKLLETTAEIRQAVAGLDRRVAELAVNANAQLAALQERQGRTDTIIGVHENRITALEREAEETCDDVEGLQRELSDLKLRLYVLIAVLSAGGGLAGSLIGKLFGL